MQNYICVYTYAEKASLTEALESARRDIGYY